MSDDRSVRLLKAIPLFADLEDGELMDVLRMATPVQIAPNEFICRQGDPGDSMYVIQAGEASVNVRGAGGTIIPVATLKAGDLLGEMTLVDAQPRSADVVASSQVRMFRIDRTQFDELRARLHPAVFKILRRIGLTVCERLRRVNESVARAVGAEAPAGGLDRATREVRTRGPRPGGPAHGAAEQRTVTDIDSARNFWGGLVSRIRGG